MRYLNIPLIEFTNARGETKLLKDLRPPEFYSSTYEIENSQDYLDMIAVRAYGDNAEPLWYKIADQNIKNIVARKFDLTQIKKLLIPII